MPMVAISCASKVKANTFQNKRPTSYSLMNW
jgi:hypothetical protein